jgi:hypothetical protein
VPPWVSVSYFVPATTTRDVGSTTEGSGDQVGTGNYALALGGGSYLYGTAVSHLYTAPTKPVLSSPILISPNDYQQFSVPSGLRTMKLTWEPVVGATNYQVDVDLRDAGPETPSNVWNSARKLNVPDTSVTFDFIGSQPGRWRVTALDNAGAPQPSQPSNLRHFDWTILPTLSTPILVPKIMKI